MPKDLPELMEEAAARGFTKNFQLKAHELHCKENCKVYTLGTIKVVETILKDPQSTDPGDEATLFLLETDDGEKGILVIGNPMSLAPEERELLDQLDKSDG